MAVLGAVAVIVSDRVLCGEDHASHGSFTVRVNPVPKAISSRIAMHVDNLRNSQAAPKRWSGTKRLLPIRIKSKYAQNLQPSHTSAAHCSGLHKKVVFGFDESVLGYHKKLWTLLEQPLHYKITEYPESRLWEQCRQALRPTVKCGFNRIQQQEARRTAK